jgi:hypothetical protein
LFAAINGWTPTNFFWRRCTHFSFAKIHRSKMTRRGARGQPHHQGARPSPWRRPPMVRAPWSTPDDAPLPIKSPRREKPNPVNFPETPRDPPPSLTRDREGPEALPGTLPERGIATRGPLHHHACLRRDE